MLSVTDMIVQIILENRTHRSNITKKLSQRTSTLEQEKALENYCKLELSHRNVMGNELKVALFTKIMSNICWVTATSQLKEAIGSELEVEVIKEANGSIAEESPNAIKKDANSGIICL